MGKACAKEDHGKIVSDKFLRLELAEQSRMTKALSSGVSWGTPAPGSKDVQIAGIEKGGKNRYNNIWPFEHARVKIQGRPEGLVITSMQVISSLPEATSNILHRKDPSLLRLRTSGV